MDGVCRKRKIVYSIKLPIRFTITTRPPSTMALGDMLPAESLERWSPRAFVVGGAAWLVLMGIIGGNMVTGGSTPTWLLPVFLVPGLLAAYLGLLGISGHVAERSPKLTRAGVAVTLIAAALVVFAVIYTVATSTVDQGPPFPVFPLIILSTVVGFLLVGLSSIRTETPSRTIGLLIAGAGAAWFGDIVFIIVTSAIGTSEIAGIPLVVGPMLGVVLAGLAMIATGYLLHGQFHRSGRVEATTDTTPK